MQELTTGAGRYANRRMYQCGTRLLFLHLLFVYLQGDSLQTKQVIKSSFLLPLIFFFFSLSPRLNDKRRRAGEAWWIHSLSRSHKPRKCRSPQLHARRFDMYSVSKPHLIHFAVSPPLKASWLIQGGFRAQERDKQDTNINN